MNTFIIIISIIIVLILIVAIGGVIYWKKFYNEEDDNGDNGNSDGECLGVINEETGRLGTIKYDDEYPAECGYETCDALKSDGTLKTFAYIGEKPGVCKWSTCEKMIDDDGTTKKVRYLDSDGLPERCDRKTCTGYDGEIYHYVAGDNLPEECEKETCPGYDGDDRTYFTMGEYHEDCKEDTCTDIDGNKHTYFINDGKPDICEINVCLDADENEIRYPATENRPSKCDDSKTIKLYAPEHDKYLIYEYGTRSGFSGRYLEGLYLKEIGPMTDTDIYNNEFILTDDDALKLLIDIEAYVSIEESVGPPLITTIDNNSGGGRIAEISFEYVTANKFYIVINDEFYLSKDGSDKLRGMTDEDDAILFELD